LAASHGRLPLSPTLPSPPPEASPPRRLVATWLEHYLHTDAGLTLPHTSQVLLPTAQQLAGLGFGRVPPWTRAPPQLAEASSHGVGPHHQQLQPCGLSTRDLHNLHHGGAMLCQRQGSRPW
jgi:hypothetical protein